MDLFSLSTQRRTRRFYGPITASLMASAFRLCLLQTHLAIFFFFFCDSHSAFVFRAFSTFKMAAYVPSSALQNLSTFYLRILFSDQFETSTSPTPPGKPRAFECFLCPGSREFDLKGHPGGGEFDFAWAG